VQRTIRAETTARHKTSGLTFFINSEDRENKILLAKQAGLCTVATEFDPFYPKGKEFICIGPNSSFQKSTGWI